MEFQAGFHVTGEAKELFVGDPVGVIAPDAAFYLKIFHTHNSGDFWNTFNVVKLFIPQFVD